MGDKGMKKYKWRLIEDKYTSKNNIFSISLFFQQKSLSLTFNSPNCFKNEIFIYEKKLYKLQCRNENRIIDLN